jgi:hypothetical protein
MNFLIFFICKIRFLLIYFVDNILEPKGFFLCILDIHTIFVLKQTNFENCYVGCLTLVKIVCTYRNFLIHMFVYHYIYIYIYSQVQILCYCPFSYTPISPMSTINHYCTLYSLSYHSTNTTRPSTTSSSTSSRQPTAASYRYVQCLSRRLLSTLLDAAAARGERLRPTP